jgi:aerobic carbon-monoxide dehydrogenase large subunit
MQTAATTLTETEKYVGKNVKIKEGPDLLAGRATFTDDMKLSGMTYVSFLRSPYAHAKINKIDIGRALRAKGVLFVLTGKDVTYECYSPSMKGVRPYTRYALPRDKVIYAGEPVAAVVTTDRYSGEDALEMIDVEYEPLPVVREADEALKADAPKVHEEMSDNLYYETHFETGNVERSFENADYTVEQTFSNGGYTGAPIECRSCIASFNPASQTLKVWLPSQLIHPLKSMLSSWLHIPEHLITVYSPQVGGGFGTKCGGFPEEVITCAISMMTGRPAKWNESRSENMMSSVQLHEIVHHTRVAFDKRGTILALSDRIVANIGSYATVGNFEPVTHSWTYLPGSYIIPNMKVDVYCVATNKGPFGAVRGFGRTMGSFTIERVLEIISQKLGIDPLEIRLRNVIKPNALPYLSATGEYYDNNGFLDCLERNRRAFKYEKWREFQSSSKRKGRLVGIGVSTSLGPSGLDTIKTQGIPGWESVWMRMDPSGKFTIASGLCANGQSHSTILSQIAADILSVGIDDIRLIEGDTDSTPYGMGSWSDRSAVAGGVATMHASKKLRERIVRIASAILDVSSDEVILRGGKAISIRDSRSVTFAEIAQTAYYRTDKIPLDMEPGMEVVGMFVPPNIRYPDESGRRNESPTYSNSSHMVALEVDPETGKVVILQYTTIHDAGTAINPGILEGQAEGCLAQGLGIALTEELGYDSSGQMIAPTFMDYLIPSADVIPSNVEIKLLETPSSVEGGFRGGGQSGSMATPGAIANAVQDALGVQANDIPLSPERIWRLMKSSLTEKFDHYN